MRGDLLRWAGPWQVVVVTATGVISRDGKEGVQRQIPVQQTAARVKTNQDMVFTFFIVSIKEKKKMYCL